MPVFFGMGADEHGRDEIQDLRERVSRLEGERTVVAAFGARLDATERHMAIMDKRRDDERHELIKALAEMAKELKALREELGAQRERLAIVWVAGTAFVIAAWELAKRFLVKGDGA